VFARVSDETTRAVGYSGRLSLCCVSYCLPSKLLRQCELFYNYQGALPLERNLGAQLVLLWLLSHLHHSAKYDYILLLLLLLLFVPVTVAERSKA
jgi:hypothetical protein